jgi:NAD+ kinase
MSAPRVLVIYKKSVYRTHVQERRASRVRELLREHQRHSETLRLVRETLKDLGARATFRFRREVGATFGYDLVVTVGGDGTLLWVSHAVGETPVLCINSAPRDSVGFFAGASASNVQERLAAALRGRLPATELQRVAVSVDGRVVETRVLNDLLLCHENPAAMSRYTLQHGRRHEDHKSSGVWIGPAAGSTAAQRSAGGKVLPPRSRLVQYVVREPYDPREAYRLTRGLVRPGERLAILSRMHEARLYVDGPYRTYRVRLGETVTVSLGPEPLTLLGFRRG